MQTIVFKRLLNYTSKLKAIYRGNVVEGQTNSTSNRSGVTWERKLSGILVLAVLAAVAALLYSIINPVKETYTEFYILDSKGGTEEYPHELKAGDEAKVLVGIVNREHQTVTYRVKINLDGITYKEIQPIVLEHKGKYEEIVSFTLDKTGDGRKVEFLLFNGKDEEVYRSVLLLIDVR